VNATDRPAESPIPAMPQALARQHQEAIWALHQTTSQLRSILLEFYPQALKALPTLTHRAALSILAVVATPSQGRKITRSRIITMLHRCGRRNDPSLVEQIFTDLHAPALQRERK
jgi:hypothetical protein